MGSGSNRLLSLLSSTTATHHIPLHHHHHHRFPCLLLLRFSRRLSSSPPLFSRRHHSTLTSSSSFTTPTSSSSRRFHSHSNSSPISHSTPDHPWPEWSLLLHILSAAGYNGLHAPDADADAFLAGDWSNDFLHAARILLSFATARPGLLRLLSRTHLELVVQNGTPFLFPSANDSHRRMTSFLSQGPTAAWDTDKAQTVDLMRYILSYASNPYSNLYNRELVEPAIRNLLTEIAKLCYTAPTESSSFGTGRSPVPAPATNEMKRGDWFCSRCDCMNFAKNVKCIECNEARPNRQLTGVEWECPQCEFFNYGRNMVCLRCDCKRPGEVSIGNHIKNLDIRFDKGGGTNKAGIDSRLAANEENAQRWLSKISQLDGNVDMRTEISDSDFPAIIPLRKGVNRFVVSKRKTHLERRNESISIKDSEPGGASGNNKFEKSEESLQSGKFMKQAGSRNKKEEADKSEGWFKRVAELHDVTDLPSAISDEDFPEIMPVRKGENHFVLSKKKDRSLASPSYKRGTAMGQADSPKYVPFVPFPPNYFAKAENPQTSGTSVDDKTTVKSTPTMTPENPPNKLFDMKAETDHSQETRVANSQSTSSTNRPPMSGYSDSNFSNPSTDSKDRFNSAFSGNLNETVDSHHPTSELNINQRWTGKSLEGSAVKEPDPLDMSEEAKAERWFKRVAQIKDISELSQIPDEDFPSIMPMRKGVNRFVISKRKTPLERRLTSPQYRKSLPIVISDPAKKDDR